MFKKVFHSRYSAFHRSRWSYYNHVCNLSKKLEMNCNTSQDYVYNNTTIFWSVPLFQSPFVGPHYFSWLLLIFHVLWLIRLLQRPYLLEDTNIILFNTPCSMVNSFLTDFLWGNVQCVTIMMSLSESICKCNNASISLSSWKPTYLLSNLWWDNFRQTFKKRPFS